MADIPKMFYRFLNNNLKSNQMTNSNLVSSKTHAEIVKFHEWLENNRNIYLADKQRMDRAYNIVRENTEQILKSRQPVNTGINKF
jgi:hypothetical protein